MKTHSINQLREVWDSVSERTGRDFSQLNVSRALVPWVYADVVRGPLTGTETVLESELVVVSS